MIGPAADPPINGHTLTGGWNYLTSIRSDLGESGPDVPGEKAPSSALLPAKFGFRRDWKKTSSEIVLQSARTRYGRFAASQVRISIHSLVSCRSS